MIQKQIDLLGLLTRTVVYTDDSSDSPDYFQITYMPDKFTAGKNIIKLRGSVALAEGTEILIDIADAANNPIFYEPLDYLDDDGSIAIAVYVYPDASPGNGYICIVGTTPETGTVKWSRDITIAPNQRNASEIIFLTGSIPQVSIRETQKSYLNQTYQQGRVVAITGSSTIKLISPPVEQIALQPAKTVLGQNRKGSPLWGKTIAPNPIIVKNQSFARSTDLITLQPNAQPTIEVATGNFTFSASMVGGTIEINAPIIDTTDGLVTGSFTYNTTITKVLNTTQARVSNTVNFTYNNANIYNIQPSEFTCSFLAMPTLTTTQNTQSYVDIRFENLLPSTGDVYKIRTYIKPLGASGEYEFINESVLDQQDVFIYTGSMDYDRHMGEFDATSVYQTYWKYKSYTDVFQQKIYNKNGLDTGNTALTSITSSRLMDALHIRPSGSTSFSYKDHLRLQLTGSYYNDYFKDGNYVVSFDAVGLSNSNLQPDTIVEETKNIPNAWIDVYMSGSAFSGPPPYSIDRIDDITLGKYIGSIFLSNNQRVNDYKLDVIPDKNGNGTPIFVVRAGEWHIGDVHVYTDMRTGFSPTYQRIVTPVPTLARNAEQQFKFQYYDYEGDEADFVTNVYGVKFDGSNFYLEGVDNLLTGSMYMGSTVGKGIEQSGKNSAMLRSAGYEGWGEATSSTGPSGFLLFSGSVLPAATSSYDGVGLELVADSNHYFRFRTNPAVLELATDKVQLSGSNVIIDTDKFFLGSNNAYISGSGNEIEISSSNFHVTSGGNMVVSNITASALRTEGVVTSDMFQYRNVVVKKISGKFNNISYYTASADSKVYSNLQLTGSYDPALAGTTPAHFIRLNESLNHPLGAINVHPPNAGGKYQYYATWVILEVAADNYIAFNKVVPIDPTDQEIHADTDDWIYKSFNKSVTLSGTAYTDLLKLTAGQRVFICQSQFDWKISAVSSYDNITPFFKDGLSTESDVDITGSLNTTGDLNASGLYVTASGQSVIQVGNTGDALSKWEWHRNGTRRWVFYNEGRTDQAPISQDSIVFKHGIITAGAGNINMSLSPNDQGVWCHGHITGSANISGSGTGSFGSLKISGATIDFTNLPTSDPGVAGRLWNDSNTVKISAG